MNAAIYALAEQAQTALNSMDLSACERRTDIPSDQNLGAAAPLSGDRVLLIGGHDGSNYLATVRCYDDALDAWTDRAPLKTARRYAVAIALDDHRILVVGGEGKSGSNAQTSAEIYDDTTNTWTTVASLPASLVRGAGAALSGGRALITGGSYGSTGLTQVYCYDATANTWTARADMLQARMDHGAAALSDDRVLVAGGYGSGNLETVECYDDASNTWAPLASMSTKRRYMAMVALNSDQVVAIGGQSVGGTNNVIESTIERYDAAANTWQQRAHMYTPRYSMSGAAPLSGNRVLIAGGNIGSRHVPWVECYHDVTPGLAPVDRCLADIMAISMSNV